MLKLMAPQFVQTDCKGHAGYTSWFSKDPNGTGPAIITATTSRQRNIRIKAKYSHPIKLENGPFFDCFASLCLVLFAVGLMSAISSVQAETQLYVLDDPSRVYQDWPASPGVSVLLPAAAKVAWPPDRQFRSVTMDEAGRGGSLFAAGDFGNAAGEVGVKLRFDGGPPRLATSLATVAYLGGEGPGEDSHQHLRFNAISFERLARETGTEAAHRLILQADVDLLAQIHTGGYNIAHLRFKNSNATSDIREVDLNGHTLALHGGVIDASVHGGYSSYGGINFNGGVLAFHDFDAGEYGIWYSGFTPAPGSIVRPSAQGRVEQSTLLYLRGAGQLLWHTQGQQALSPHNAQFGRTIGPLHRWDTRELVIEIANNRYQTGQTDWEVWSNGEDLKIGVLRVGGEYPADIRLVDRWSSTAGQGSEVLAVGKLNIEANARLECDGVSIICDSLTIAGAEIPPGVYAAADLSTQISDLATRSRITVGDVPLPVPASIAKAQVTLVNSGLVSAGIYDPEGRLLRNLIFGDKMEAGKMWLAWDGLDELGNPMTPGDYEWRVLTRQPFVATLVANLGVSHPEGAARAWGGNHRGPESVASDKDGYYIGFPHSEGTGLLLALYPDGTRRWTLTYKDKYANAPEAMATDGAGRLVMLAHPNGNGLRLNVLSTLDGGFINGFQAAIDPAPAPWGWIHNVRIAAHDGVAVISYRTHDRVRWIDLKDGREMASANLPAPDGITMDADGVAWIVTSDGVVRWQRDGEPEKVWKETQLDAPQAIAWDAKSGNFLIAEGGTQQIVRVTRTGKVVRRFGRAGGREFGPWHGENFLDVCDLAPDGEGGFLVTELRIRRTARFDGKGKLVAEWFGGQRWGHCASLDPEAPTLGVIEGGEKSLALVRMDHKAGTWKMLETFAEPDTCGIFPVLQSEKWELRRHGGRLWHVFINPNAGIAAYEIDRKNGKLIPRAMLGRMDLRKNLPPLWSEAMALQELTSKPNGFVWSDDNGDGILASSEVTFGAYNFPWGFNLDVAKDWTLTLGDASTKSAWVTISNLNAADPATPPRWDLNGRTQSEATWPEQVFNQEAYGTRPSTIALLRGDDGETWELIRGHGAANEDRQGGFWPEFYGGSDRLVKWNADGEAAWVVGRHIGGRGRFTCAYGLLGPVCGNMVVRDRYGIPTSIWAEDGLYAGNLMESWPDDGYPSWVYDYWNDHADSLLEYDQNFNGLWSYSDGSVYYSMQGRSSSPVFRIDGWDNWQRQRGKIELKSVPSAAAQKGTGLQAAYFANPDLAGNPIVTQVDPQIWFEASPRLTDGLIRATWGQGSPVEGVPADGFSVRWTGEIEPRFTEPYRLIVETDLQAKVRVWLGDEWVIDDDGTANCRSARIDRNFPCRRNASRPIELNAGQRYPLRIEFSHSEGESGIHLMWQSRTQERLHVPSTALYPPPLPAPTTQ